jgi:hypothetical protein
MKGHKKVLLRVRRGGCICRGTDFLCPDEMEVKAAAVKETIKKWCCLRVPKKGKEGKMKTKTKAKKKSDKMGTWIKSDGTMIPVVPEKGTKFSLAECQKMVGGWVERLQLPERAVMLVNEEGIPMKLPGNHEASRIAGRPLYGDVVLLPRGMGW